MHDCRKIREEILDLVFDELGQESELRLMAQIEACQTCRTLYQTMTETLMVFDRFDQATEASLPVAEPWPGYTKLRAELIQDHEPSWWQRVIGGFTSLRFTPVVPRWSLTAAVGFLLLALALGWWLSLPRTGKAPTNNLVVRQTPEPEKPPKPEESVPQIVLQLEKKPAGQKTYLVTKPRHLRLPALPDERSQGQAGTGAVAMLPPPTPAAGPLPGLQMARHFEKAELLLRAFRNAQPSEDAAAMGAADERQRSRRLVYQNMVLRREAETAGDASVKQLLSRLEPLLLDIANLPDQPSSAEVRAIQARIQQREIVAVLQVHSALTASSEPSRN